MVDETRRLERALGGGKKKIEKNEILTSYIQRRSYYSVREIKKGEKIKKDSVFPLRPYLKNSISPKNEKLILNKRAKKNIKKGECIKKNLIH